MSETTIGQRTADLDLLAYATLRALRNGATQEQVGDAVAYTRVRFLRDPNAKPVATSRVGNPGAGFEALEEAVAEYREWNNNWDEQAATPAEVRDHDEAEVDYLYAIRDAASKVA